MAPCLTLDFCTVAVAAVESLQPPLSAFSSDTMEAPQTQQQQQHDRQRQSAASPLLMPSEVLPSMPLLLLGGPISENMSGFLAAADAVPHGKALTQPLPQKEAAAELFAGQSPEQVAHFPRLYPT